MFPTAVPRLHFNNHGENTVQVSVYTYALHVQVLCMDIVSDSMFHSQCVSKADL